MAEFGINVPPSPPSWWWISQDHRHEEGGVAWTTEDEKLFERALAQIDADAPDRWERIAAMMPRKTVADVVNHYKHLDNDSGFIGAGLLPLPQYRSPPPSSGFTLNWNSSDGGGVLGGAAEVRRNTTKIKERCKDILWTEEEQKLFLLGLKKYGRGDWMNISRNFVTSRTPTEVASYAQNYFSRLQNSLDSSPSRTDPNSSQSDDSFTMLEEGDEVMLMLSGGGGGEKKRRLSVEQVDLLERSFDEENKLQPEFADFHAFLVEKQKWAQAVLPSGLVHFTSARSFPPVEQGGPELALFAATPLQLQRPQGPHNFFAEKKEGDEVEKEDEAGPPKFFAEIKEGDNEVEKEEEPAPTTTWNWIRHCRSNPRNMDVEALDYLKSFQRQIESSEGLADEVVNNEYLQKHAQEVPGERRFLSNEGYLLTSDILPPMPHGFWEKDDPGLGWGIGKANAYGGMKRTFVFHEKEHQSGKQIKTSWVMTVHFLLDSSNKVQNGLYLCHVFQSDDYDPRPKCIPSLPPTVDPANHNPTDGASLSGTGSDRKGKRRRSDVWNEFTEIEARVPGRKKLTMAICNHCCMVYGPGSTNGTTTLKNHTQGCNHQVQKNCRLDMTQMDCPVDGASKGIRLPSNIKQYEDLPRDYDCTDKDLLAIEYLKSAPETEKLVDIDGAFLYQTHMKCLIQPNTYLLGIVINAYINCIRSLQHLNNRDDGKVFLEDTFISAKLKENGNHIPRKDDEDAARFLVDKVEKYLEYDMVFLPININDEHWYLAVINAAKHKIQVLDSLCWSSRRNELYQTLKGIEHNFNILTKGYVMNHKWKDLNVTRWEFDEHLLVPIQRDGVSCGLFMLKFMEYWRGNKLSIDITQDDVSKFRMKLAAVLIRWKTNSAKLTPHVEAISDTGNNISDYETIDNTVGQKKFTDIRAAKPSKLSDLVTRKYNSVLRVVSFVGKQELVSGICNYIRSIDDAYDLEKEWVRNSTPYPISLSLKKIKDILNDDNFMDPDCFNLGVRKLACDELPVMKERNEVHGLRHYMDLEFLLPTSQEIYGSQCHVHSDDQQPAISLDSWPKIEPYIPLCKMTFVPMLEFGQFTLYVLDHDAKTVFILDPNYSHPGTDENKQMKRYLLHIIKIASWFRLAMRKKCPGYDEDIYFWPHKVPKDVPTNKGALSGYLSLLFMHAWDGERLHQPLCNDGYELRKQFLIGLLMYQGNECEENIHDGVREILKCIKNLSVS